MQHCGAGHSIGTSFGTVHNVIPAANTAAADDRHIDRLGHSLDQFQVHAALQALVVHAHQQDLPCPKRHAAFGPFHYIITRMGAAVVIISFPLAGPGAVALGLDGKHHALAAKGVGNLGDQLRAFDGRRVDGNLIRPHGKNVAHILDAAQTAAHADRDIHIIHGFAHNIRKVVTVIQAGHNINVQQLVNALLIIFPCKQVGIPQLAQALQLDAFDKVGILDIQPCNQADFFLSHKKFLSSRALGQYRTIPALRLKHRSGGCGTASALPKYSIIHKVLSALLAWHLPHLARRIGT